MYLLLTNRLPNFSTWSFVFCFVLILIGVLFSWPDYWLVVQLCLSLLVFCFKKLSFLLLVLVCCSKYVDFFFFFCICKVVFVSIGKTLLRKDVIHRMSVLIIITLLYRDKIIGESLLICFSILSNIIFEFIWFPCCKCSLKYIPNIFMVSYCSLILISFGRFVIFSVFIGNTAVFSKLIIGPVGSFNFWKYFKTFFTNYCFCAKKIESSVYSDILTCFLYLV